MATASKKKTKTSKKKKDIDEDAQLGQPINRFEICNIHGIKERPIWKLSNRYDYTYFILPPPPSTYEGTINFEVNDFIKFWHELDDSHKERRLLADYMAAISTVVGDPKLQDAPEFFIRLFPFKQMDKRRNEIFQQLLPYGVMSIIGSLFLGDQRKVGKFTGAVQHFYQAQIENKVGEGTRKCFSLYFEKFVAPVLHQYREALKMEFGEGHPFLEMKDPYNDYCFACEETKNLWKATFKTFLTMYSIWKSHDEIGRQRYLKKLKVSVPHWRKEDRLNILRIMDAKFDEPPLCNFMKEFFDSEGPEQFKFLVFGKEKFCANCNRSSYIGEDRLWSCKRCVKEHIRPKARYCNTECQKAHWLKHKSEKHSSGKPKQEKKENMALKGKKK